MYGNPKHITSPAHMSKVIGLLYVQVKKYCHKEGDWVKMIDRAKSNAYNFPSFPHFLTTDSRKKQQVSEFSRGVG
jgi:hypothetical protein